MQIPIQCRSELQVAWTRMAVEEETGRSWMHFEGRVTGHVVELTVQCERASDMAEQ